jgi:hypothetical protein
MKSRAAICISISLLACVPVSSHAAVIFSDVDPYVTDILTLAEQIAGAFEDNNNNNTGFKVIHGWGRVVGIGTTSTLRTAILPFNVGASAGLRIDVFELPSPPYTNRFGTVTTTNFVHRGSSTSVESLAGGRQWVTFSFAAGIPLEAGKSYLFRSSTDETLADPAAQSHYWLSSGSPSGWIVDDRAISSNSPVPESTFGDTREVAGLAGSIYLSDTSVAVPEPATHSALLVGTALLAFMRRRNCG